MTVSEPVALEIVGALSGLIRTARSYSHLRHEQIDRHMILWLRDVIIPRVVHERGRGATHAPQEGRAP